MYGNRSISSPDVRNVYCQPPSVACYHDAAMSAIMIHCQNHTTRNNGRYSRRRGRPRRSWRYNIKEWIGQSLLSLLRIADDICRWATITAEASVGVNPTTPGRHRSQLVCIHQRFTIRRFEVNSIVQFCFSFKGQLIAKFNLVPLRVYQFQNCLSSLQLTKLTNNDNGKFQIPASTRVPSWSTEFAAFMRLFCCFSK